MKAVSLKIFGIALSVIGIALLIAAIAALLFEPVREDPVGPRLSSDGSGSPATASAGATSGNAVTNSDSAVRMQGWIETNKLDHNGRLHAHVVFENHGTSSIDLLQFQTVSPGFHEVSRNLKNLGAVKSGESVPVDVELQPDKPYGHFWIVALSEYKAGNQFYRKSMALGPVEITNSWREYLLPVSRLQGLFLPGILAVLGIAFQKAAARQAQVDEVWKNLLPQFMERAELYYMPLNRAAKDLETYASDLINQDSAERLRRAFYQLMLFLHRMKLLKEKIGGVTFRSRPGEKLIGHCLLSIRELAETKLENLEYRDAILGLMKENDTYGKFEEWVNDPPDSIAAQNVIAREAYLRWEQGNRNTPAAENWLAAKRAPFTVLEAKTKAWLRGTDYRDLELYLKALVAALSIELNMPLERWYGKKEKIIWADLKKLKSDLFGRHKDIAAKKFADLTTRPERRKHELLRLFKAYVHFLRRDQWWLTRGA